MCRHISIYPHTYIHLHIYKILFKDYKSKCISYYLKQTDQGDGLLSAFSTEERALFSLHEKLAFSNIYYYESYVHF